MVSAFHLRKNSLGTVLRTAPISMIAPAVFRLMRIPNHKAAAVSAVNSPCASWLPNSRMKAMRNRKNSTLNQTKPFRSDCSCRKNTVKRDSCIVFTCLFSYGTRQSSATYFGGRRSCVILLSLRGELSVSQQKLFLHQKHFFAAKPPAAMHPCVWPERLLFVKQTVPDC